MKKYYTLLAILLATVMLLGSITIGAAETDGDSVVIRFTNARSVTVDSMSVGLSFKDGHLRAVTTDVDPFIAFKVKVETAKYPFMVIRYRMSGPRTENNMYLADTKVNTNFSGMSGTYMSPSWTCDGEWHNAVINVPEVFPAMADVTLTAVRLPGVKEIGGTLEVEYAAFFKTVEGAETLDGGRTEMPTEAPTEPEPDEPYTPPDPSSLPNVRFLTPGIPVNECLGVNCIVTNKYYLRVTTTDADPWVEIRTSVGTKTYPFMVLEYRISGPCTSNHIYLRDVSVNPNFSGMVGTYRSPGFVTDGEWHFAVYDIQTDFKPLSDTTLVGIRVPAALDVGGTIDIKSVAFFKTEAEARAFRGFADPLPETEASTDPEPDEPYTPPEPSSLPNVRFLTPGIPVNECMGVNCIVTNKYYLRVTTTDADPWVEIRISVGTKTYPFMVLEYRISGPCTSNNLYLCDASVNPSYSGMSGTYRSPGFVTDGEWHFAVYDIQKEFSALSDTTLVGIRVPAALDVGGTIDIKSVAFFKTEAEARAFRGFADPLPETQAPTDPATEPATEPPTEPVTEPVTQPVTEPVTGPVTEPVTQSAVTEPETQADTGAETGNGSDQPGGRVWLIVLSAAVGTAAAVWFVILLIKKDGNGTRRLILMAVSAVILIGSITCIILLCAAGDRGREDETTVTDAADTVSETLPATGNLDEDGQLTDTDAVDTDTADTASETLPDPSQAERYTGPYSSVNGALAGIDDLGRVMAENIPARENRQVGVFYFIHRGEGNPFAPAYCVSDVLARDPEAYLSIDRWTAAGGGWNISMWWGTPLFGYYAVQDEWVLARHAMMLADAGVDYIIFDTTNALYYPETVEVLLRVFDKYDKQGVKVPRVAFYTNTESGLTATRIYEYIYKKFNDQYGHLWFRWDGKPLIIAESNGLSKEIRDFFTIKKPIWPTDPNYARNAWPWMEFGRLYTRYAVYGPTGGRIVNVSAAQHCDTIMFSETAFYGGNDHTRSWHDGANDTSPDAPLYGYNFAEQWEWALGVDPETVFVTAFNEWTAGCLHQRDTCGPIQMCDCCDMNCSRDIEPMQGGFGDNYFMQLAEYIRKYKGCDPRVDVGPDTTVDMNGSFRQFDAATAVYTDPVGDTENRNHAGYGTVYTDDSGRNDIAEIRVMKDTDNYYVYVRTADALTAPAATGWMTLFIDSGADGGFGNAWDVAVNRTAPQNGVTAVERWQDGSWQAVGEARIRYEGNELMLSVPRALIDRADTDGLCDIRFKVADNYDPADVMSFYTSGDSAPYGRFSFIFSDVPAT